MEEREVGSPKEKFSPARIAGKEENLGEWEKVGGTLKKENNAKKRIKSNAVARDRECGQPRH